tara:strand:+ start:811 stop:1050 length:240 start_codon:yes stop_codon:yes gene_type:complete
MLQATIVMVQNGYMVQLPPMGQGAPGQPPQPVVMVYPDLDSAINATRDIFERTAEASADAQKALEEAKAETEKATKGKK